TISTERTKSSSSCRNSKPNKDKEKSLIFLRFVHFPHTYLETFLSRYRQISNLTVYRFRLVRIFGYLLNLAKMALGKKRIVAQKSNLKHRRDVDDGGLGLELELVQYKRGFGRKRILISSGDEKEDSDFTSSVGKVSSKMLCDKISVAVAQSQELEDLPLDILVRIICGVEHEDLKQLFLVSKTIREASLIAKQSHFAYSTPRKTSVCRFGLDKPFGLTDDETEAPGAPLQKRYRPSQINRKEDDSGVSVALFN
ncbi:unnamed protein product, partial [Thlaspi arvense]